jgi:putative transposase
MKARQWVLEFTHYYNYEHCHSWLNFLTPIQRHTGMDKEIFSNRTAIYEAARQNNPNRWTKNIRKWSLENEVWLNPEKDETNTTNKSVG